MIDLRDQSAGCFPPYASLIPCESNEGQGSNRKCALEKHYSPLTASPASILNVDVVGGVEGKSGLKMRREEKKKKEKRGEDDSEPSVIYHIRQRDKQCPTCPAQLRGIV